ncbi:hypothetical protein [Polycladidibacter stylochi]|uniref:hypothetical protein n=1 Tax=Polycladidibacter stylochi TaxID=1807766 RepID=UPI00082EB978|nr:hypothetical protein [Pseudovibrio stylochi]
MSEGLGNLKPLQTFIAVVFSLIILGFGFAFLWREQGLNTQANLLICSGLGLVFAVYGSTVHVNWIKGATITGSAGITYILFTVLQGYTYNKLEYVRGKIHQTKEVKNLFIFAEGPVLSGRSESNGNFEFVAFPQQLDAEVFYISIENDKDHPMRIYSLGCIPTRLLKAHMHKQKPVTLQLAFKDDGIPYLWSTSEQKSYGLWSETNQACPQQQADLLGGLKGAINTAYSHLAVMNHAYADGLKTLSNPLEIEAAIGALEHGDLATRNIARDTLSKNLNKPSVQEAFAQSWDVKRNDYNADFGNLTAWRGAIKVKPELSISFTEVLEAEQLQYVFQLSAHPDRSVSYIASGLIKSTLESTSLDPVGGKDARSKLLTSALDVFQQQTSADFIFHSPKDSALALKTLSLLSESICLLSPEEKKQIAEKVKGYSFEGSEAQVRSFENMATQFQGATTCP